MGFCLQIAFGREPAFRRLAKCDAGSSRTGGFFPPRRGFSALVWRIAPAFFHIVRTLAQRWLFPLRPHTLAVWAENRTQRRHAAHGALQVLGTPAGSIGSIFSTVGRSAPSTLFRQIRRSPLLFRNDTKMPFFLRASTLFSDLMREAVRCPALASGRVDLFQQRFCSGADFRLFSQKFREKICELKR